MEINTQLLWTLVYLQENIKLNLNILGSAALQGSHSYKRAVRSENIWVALAIHVLSVAFNAVAAVDLCEGRRYIGRRTKEVGVGESTGKLYPLLTPVSPQNALNLQEEPQRGCKKDGNLTYRLKR